MADNVAITAGSGTSVATDDVSSVHFQKIKVDAGGDGVSVPIVAGQQARAASVPVALATEDVAALASQATLASILAKILTAPSTEAKQDIIIGHVDGLEAAFTTMNAKDFATQTTLAAVLAKIIAAPATEAKQDSSITQETAINTVLGVKGDAKSTATDTTAITAMSVWKQISASVQAAAASIAGTLTVGLPSGASTAANQSTIIAALAAIQTAVEIIDNAVSGSEFQVDVVGALPAGTNNIGDVDVLTVPADPFGANADAAVLAGAAGSMQAKLRLMTSQLDAVKTAVETIDNAIAGSEMQVDIVGPLPAGTNAIGKLAANTGVDIGDVDVTSLPALPAGTNNIGDVDVLTVPADPFGANADVAVAAGAEGSIQAKLRRISSDIDAIKTAVEALDNTVGGSELQVDVVGALPAGTNAIGKLAANSGVDIGDVDVTSIAGLGTALGEEYETVAASQTAQALGATGGTGDYIAGILVVPATTAPGNVLLLDNATSITVFVGGTGSVSNLVPFFIPLGIKSVSGAWKITTGANVSAIGIGNFT